MPAKTPWANNWWAEVKKQKKTALPTVRHVRAKKAAVKKTAKK